MACYSCVSQGTVEMIERFGKFQKVAEPGFTCLIPCCGESSSGRLSLRVQQLDVQCETKTKDNVFVNVIVSVQFQVIREKIYDAYYRLTDPYTQIRAYVYDVVRAAVPKINLDDVFTTKEEIAQGVKVELTKSMDSFGYQIIQALVTDIEPAGAVKAAMNEINAAQRLRQAATDKAEAAKIGVVKNAEADAEAKFLQGTGIARQRQAIVNGLRESVRVFAEEIPGVTSKDVMDLMLMTQYFDMMKDIGADSKTNAVFIPHNNVSDMASAMRNGVLQAQSMQR